MDIKSRVAIVTGAGRGIGRAIALMLARSGAHVVLASRTEKQLQDVASEIVSAGGAASVFTADMAQEQDIVTLFRNTAGKYGKLDILINNAGFGIFGPVSGFSTEDLDTVLDLNLRGCFICCREAMKLMIPRKSGYIINISSVVGFKGYPSQAAYTAAKHGIMGITKSLAVEAQEHNIRVSVVSPGGVDTEMIRQARPDLDPETLLKPEDIAQTVEYLLSLPDRAAVDEIYIRRRNSSPF